MKSFAYYGVILWALLLMISCSNELPETISAEYKLLPENIDYNYHVKPILADRCYQCHGPDESSRKGGLRLDIEEEAFRELASGKRAFEKGNIGGSEAIHRLITDREDLKMPPRESNLTISEKEIAILAKWVEQGAEWKKHWSFIPVSKSDVPSSIEKWEQKNPIDNFIQQKLSADTDLSPNKRERSEILFRRVTMDLTGLPPGLKQLDEFLQNPSEDKLITWVDSLFKTDAYAERMAMEWMDIARYADSQGMAFDGARTSWPYRDWLIEAFQKNIHYDDFITQQVAGDLLDSANKASMMATAFYRLNPMEGSGGSIPEEFRVEYVNERAGLTGSAFLGLTLECAKCHDHKFDPIKQKEFYQIAAFFNNTAEMGLAAIDNDRPPTLMLYTDEQLQQIDSMVAALNGTEKEVLDFKSKYASRDHSKNKLPKSVDKSELQLYIAFDEGVADERVINPKAPKKFQLNENFFAVDGEKKVIAKTTVKFTEGHRNKSAYFNDAYASIVIEDTTDFDLQEPFSIHAFIKSDKDSIGESQTIAGTSTSILKNYSGWEFALDSTFHLRARLIHRRPDDYLEVRSLEQVKLKEWTSVAMTYDGLGKANGLNFFIDGKKVKARTIKDNLNQSPKELNLEYGGKTNMVIGASKRFYTEDQGHFIGNIDELSIYKRQLSQYEVALLNNNKFSNPSEEMKQDHFLLNTGDYKKLTEKRRSILGALVDLRDTTTELMVLEDLPEKRTTYVLKGGLYNQHLDSVTEGGVDAVMPFSEDLPKNRLGLAQWLTDKENPLVARVAVNRYWKMLFGRGLVESAEDFGIQGSLPTHPELLDWLTADFVENDWDIQRLLKLMISSATYQQSSLQSVKQAQTDPTNLFYSYFPSYRLPAEMLRDNILAGSGLLVQKVGGPPTKPYQPKGVWKELEGSPGLSKYKQDTLDNLYRRSMYTFVRRFGPNPTMSNFDVPNREVCVVRRNITHTPLQALTLLNSTQFVEAARCLAEEVESNNELDLEAKFNYMYRSLTSLNLEPNKSDVLKSQFEKSLIFFQENPQNADSLLMVGDKPFDKRQDKMRTAALTLVASTIINSDESYMKR